MKFLILLCLIVSPLFAQKSQYQEITLEDGLSQGMIFDLIEDRENFIWIGTKNGLNRFDGYNYKVFLPETGNPYAISDSQISALCEDAHGRIWIGTASQGINLFDKRTQRFYHCTLRDPARGKTGETLPNENISAIRNDLQGNIWAGTMSGKLFRIQLPPHLAQDFPDQPDFTKEVNISIVEPVKRNLETSNIKVIQRASNGMMWVAFGPDLHRLDPVTGTLELVDMSPVSHWMISAVKDELDGSVIVSKVDRIVRVKDLKVVETLFFDRHTSNSRSLYIDNSKTVWRRSNGLIYPVKLDKIDQLESEPTSAMKVGGTCHVSRVMIDHEENVWIGTNGYGIRKQNALQKRFTNYLPDQSIWHVYEDSKQQVFCWDYTRIYLLDKNTGLSSDRVLLPQYEGHQKGNLIEDRRGGYWGIVRKGKESLNMLLVKLDENFKTVSETDLDRKGDFVNARIVQDRTGDIWIAGGGTELIRFEPENKKISYYDYRRILSENQSSVTVMQIYEDTGGVIWLGTDVGLIKSTPKGRNRLFSRINLGYGPENSREENSINALCDDPLLPDEFLWIGSRGGLLRMSKKKPEVRRFTEKEGLSNQVVVAVMSDKNGQIWAGTYRGISRVNTRTMQIINYSSRDGLQSEEYNSSCFFKNKNGELLFGGISGLTIFNPDQSWKESLPPTVRMVGFTVNNRRIAPDDDTGILKEAIEYTDAVNLSHQQNILGFEFSTLDMNNSPKNRYRYKLVGVDKEWIEAGTNRFAGYAHLPPGRYQLEAVATFDGSSWSERPLVFHITITPPWYRTWWAFLGYLIILASFIYFLYKAQMRRVLLHEQLIYRKRETQRLSELDQLKTRFFTNISHEFRTPLTLLRTPLEDLQRQFPDQSIFTRMKRNADRLLELINQMLDLGKLEAGQMQVKLTQGDLAGFIRTIGSSFSSMGESRSMRFLVEQNSQSVPARYDADKTEKIISNLLSNAFKFTPDGGNIILRTTFEQQRVTIEVEDDGVGISSDEIKKVFNRFYQVDHHLNPIYAGTGIGLALVKELVDLPGGEVSVRSREPSGSVFRVVLPFETSEIEKTSSDYAIPPKNAPIKETVTYPNRPEDREEEREEDTVRENVMLIVEDNEDLRSYISDIFSDHFTIIEAHNGTEGLKKALANIPDVIVSDLMMPGLDGFALCRALKTNEKTSHIPVMLLTARAGIDDRITGLALEADDYLVKPFDTREIRARIQNLVAVRTKLRSYYAGVIVDLQPTEVQVDSLDEHFVRQAKTVVERHLSSNTFDIDLFASEMNMSSRQLRRKMQSLTGMSPVEFIRRYRLRSAAALLRSKSANVSEAAYATGFESMSYFAKKFQEEFGVLPSEYADA